MVPKKASQILLELHELFSYIFEEILEWFSQQQLDPQLLAFHLLNITLQIQNNRQADTFLIICFFWIIDRLTGTKDRLTGTTKKLFLERFPPTSN